MVMTTKRLILMEKRKVSIAKYLKYKLTKFELEIFFDWGD